MKRFVVPLVIEIAAPDMRRAKKAYGLIKGALTSTAHSVTRKSHVTAIRMLDQPMQELQPHAQGIEGVREEN